MNWRIIALQNFVGSCQTSIWITIGYTYVPNTFYISSFQYSRCCRQNTCHGSVVSEASSKWFIFLSVLVCSTQSLSRVWLFVTPWTVACQAPLSMEFSRSGELFPSPADLPHPGIEPRSPALQVDSLPSEPKGKPSVCVHICVHTRAHTHTGILFSHKK